MAQAHDWGAIHGNEVVTTSDLPPESLGKPTDGILTVPAVKPMVAVTDGMDFDGAYEGDERESDDDTLDLYHNSDDDRAAETPGNGMLPPPVPDDCM